MKNFRSSFIVELYQKYRPVVKIFSVGDIVGGNKQKTIQDNRVPGSGDFVTEILKEADKNLKGQLRLRERQDLIERIIKEMCEEEGIEERELRSGGRRGIISRGRARIAYRLGHGMGVPTAEIARRLGVCTSAIVKAIQKLEIQKEK
ncbi:MAG: hypothetical protein AB1502_01105 [Thermodesulfobacteriota bacterium]